jgi:PAS domain S-box-containing protein
MTDKKIPQIDSAELRSRAEELLREKTGTAHPPGTEDELLRLHHELQVHQVELEMQNAELRQTRDDLEKALEKFTDLYDFAPVGYFTLDSKETIHNVNLTGAALVGIERSRLIGKRFGPLVADMARSAFTAFLEKVFSSPAKVACEVALRKEGDNHLWMQVEGMAAASGKECRIALIDITERKQAEEALRLGKEAAEALRLEEEARKAFRLKKEADEALRLEKEIAKSTAQAKNQFFINMSHELRTPMTGILGMLQLTLEEELAPVLRDYLEMTLSSANSLLRIINDILDMAKFEAGKLIIEEKPFSLQECITQAVDIITPEVRRKRLDFAVAVAEEVPVTVVGDNMRIRQVLLNIIGNAVKFTEGGKVVVRVTAGRPTGDGKRELTFTVTDTGIGIPDDKKDILFRAFSQIDASLNRGYGGTGLGLAISKEIVELMGGTISFVSERGVGTTFSFTIPLGEAGLEREVFSAAKSLSSEVITTSQEREKIPRILLAEDDSIIRQVLGLMLKKSNYNLDIAEDGLKAVEMWEKGDYDLVLMDVQMPRLNGFEVTSAIREKERERGGHTPIVAVTAHARQEDEEICIAAGMDAYISKPIDFKQCLQVIGDILEQKSSSIC